MDNKIIADRLKSYESKTDLQEENALKEIVQELILAALAQGDFFLHAVFQGGTALRILYGLPRFSEDTRGLKLWSQAYFTNLISRW